MANKRLKKKQTKQKQQQYLQQKTNSSRKEIQKLSNQELNKQYTKIVTKEKQKEQRKKSFSYRISRKRQRLYDLGFTDALAKEKGKNLISDKKIDSIKLSDLERNINRDNYAFLFGTDKFDFDKIYTVANGERLYFAYQDWTGEMPTFLENIQTFFRYSSQELLDFLQGALDMPQTGSKGSSGSSSGKAGTYRFQVGKQEVISAFQNDTYAYNRTKKSKRKFKKKHVHSLDYRQPFQVLKNGSRNSFDKVTGRNLLIIANSIMYNVNEVDRVAFYNEFYPAINRVLPEIGKILPKPN